MSSYFDNNDDDDEEEKEHVKFEKLNTKFLNSQDVKNKKKTEEKERDYYFEFWVMEWEYYYYNNNNKKEGLYNVNQDISPQELLLYIIEGKRDNHLFLLQPSSSVVRQFFAMKKFLDVNDFINWLANLVTPFQMKNVWVEREKLVEKEKIQLFAKLNIMQMIDVLSAYPNPQYPSIISEKNNITNPNDFVLIINKIMNCGMGYILNFWPYIHHKNLYIKRGGFYQICNDCIRLIDPVCFDYSRKEEVIPPISLPISVIFEEEEEKEKFEMYLASINNDYSSLVKANERVVSEIIMLYFYILLIKYKKNNPPPYYHLWIYDIFNDYDTFFKKKINQRIDNLRSNEKYYKGILFPICHENHYYLIEFEFVNYTIYIYNSLHTENKDINNFIKLKVLSPIQNEEEEMDIDDDNNNNKKEEKGVDNHDNNGGGIMVGEDRLLLSTTTTTTTTAASSSWNIKWVKNIPQQQLFDNKNHHHQNNDCGVFIMLYARDVLFNNKQFNNDEYNQIAVERKKIKREIQNFLTTELKHPRH